MKKTLLFGSLVLLIIFGLNKPAYSQADVYLDKINVYVSKYGRIALYTLPDEIRQLYKMALLVGTGKNSVFDLEYDSDIEESTVELGSSSVADNEIYGSYNNDGSAEPPNILEKLRVYCWKNLNSILVKYTVINRESTEIDAKVGLELIPNLNKQYGGDTVSYNETKKITRIHRGGVNLGYKLLSHELKSLYSFEYYEDYEVDSSYWNWLNHGSIQKEYISDSEEGEVVIMSQASQKIAPNDSVTIYYAVSVGVNEADMLAGIDAVQSKYDKLTSVESDYNNIPTDFVLDQNYPNPFNPGTRISFSLPHKSNVVLKVFNALGQQVAKLVNETLDAGTHYYNFDASGLASGIYIYSLQTDAGVISKKMTLIK